MNIVLLLIIIRVCLFLSYKSFIWNKLIFILLFLQHAWLICNLLGFFFFYVSLQQIHTLVMSLNFTAIEIKTINSLDSWDGGVLVMLSGSVKIKDFNGRRKFVQTFFLAPQDKGYFVLNDIFQYFDDGMIYQHPASTLQENKLDAQLNVSSPVAEPPGTVGKLFSNFNLKFLFTLWHFVESLST